MKTEEWRSRPALGLLLICLTGTTGCGFIWDLGTTIARSNGVSVSKNGEGVLVRMRDEPPVEGSGTVAEEAREVVGFDRLIAKHGIRVAVETAEEGPAAVAVVADDNLLPLIETAVEGGVLHVRLIGSLKTNNPIRVNVQADAVTHLEAYSNATVDADRVSGEAAGLKAGSNGRVVVGSLEADAVRLSASSNGRLTVHQAASPKVVAEASSNGRVTANQVAGDRLKASVSSNGKVTASGSIKTLNVHASSNGSFEGAELSCESSQADCSSAGVATVHVTKELTGSASSAGKVRYYGSPSTVEVSTSSAGKLVKAG